MKKAVKKNIQEIRSLNFNGRSHNRYVWYNRKYNDFIPPVYSFLSNNEWKIMNEWFEETEKSHFIGEMPIPLISVIQGFMMGSRINNIVQLGTYAGYSSLMIGFMLKKMGIKNSFVSIDIDEPSMTFARKQIEKAKLGDYVKTYLGNSSNPEFVDIVFNHFNKQMPRCIIIDSSHQKEHTIEELNLWYKALVSGGLFFLHDTSEMAQLFDSTQKGGVKAAIEEWSKLNPEVKQINICNLKSTPADSINRVYEDGCGIGIMQKPDQL